MIKGFSEETQPLTEYERKVILPIILEGLKTKIGKANAVTNKYIISRLRDGYKIDAARLRKIINHIRTNDLLPGLIATSEGYFLATTESELLEYIFHRESNFRFLRAQESFRSPSIYMQMYSELDQQEQDLHPL